ncbi:hypothetical protein [Streptomyces aurantiogriseus]|uniref:Uncharacterized protein n=1 Tax=Streptomyces aurantiogriseus TaxID=66870 RepID=A0A918CBI4_9ACTN|nr:hypothetical protein [Streptomyces aurantiogriseus]GGR15432.1 hypothetical protein GCM10010251_34420 [Streptomyces aurantiogriseus]
MLALRLIRSAHPAVQVRRLLVATASAGTGFLLLGTLGHALTHPETPAASALRLAWCTVPLAATVQFALAVARTDPGTRPRPGLAAIGLGPARLMAVSATTTALSTTLGSVLALLIFLHLRGDLTGMPFDGAASTFLAADIPLPLPAALTLLTWVPATASVAVALSLRPRDTQLAATSRGTGRTPGWFRGRETPGAYGGFGARKRTGARETFGAYGRFGRQVAQPIGPAGRSSTQKAAHDDDTQPPHQPAGRPSAPGTDDGTQPSRQAAGNRAAGAARVGAGGTPPAPGSATHPPAPANGTPETPDHSPNPPAPTDGTSASQAQVPNPTALPWGAAILAAGLAVEAYASHTTSNANLTVPGGPTGPAAVLIGWALTAVGLALAGPGLTHLCGRLLQAARPGALRLLAGRGLMQEASRIGRPLGILCAVASGAYGMAALYDPSDPTVGPLTTLGALLVVGCTLATLLTAAVEARQARADTTAALLRLGAPATTLRSAAALRAGALAALFVPLTLIVAELAALPLAG